MLIGSSSHRFHGGRPSLPGALALALLAAGLLTFDRREGARARPSEWGFLAAGLIAMTALLGVVVDAELLYRFAVPFLNGMSLPTSVSVLILSVVLLLERPTGGIMTIATSPGPGGMQLRRLLLPAIAVPLLLGLGVRLFLQAAGTEELVLFVAVLV